MERAARPGATFIYQPQNRPEVEVLDDETWRSGHVLRRTSEPDGSWVYTVAYWCDGTLLEGRFPPSALRGLR